MAVLSISQDFFAYLKFNIILYNQLETKQDVSLKILKVAGLNPIINPSTALLTCSSTTNHSNLLPSFDIGCYIMQYKW